jgi:hypothetical protein
VTENACPISNYTEFCLATAAWYILSSLLRLWQTALHSLPPVNRSNRNDLSHRWSPHSVSSFRNWRQDQFRKFNSPHSRSTRSRHSCQKPDIICNFTYSTELSAQRFALGLVLLAMLVDTALPHPMLQTRDEYHYEGMIPHIVQGLANERQWLPGNHQTLYQP